MKKRGSEIISIETNCGAKTVLNGLFLMSLHLKMKKCINTGRIMNGALSFVARAMPKATPVIHAQNFEVNPRQ